MPSLGNLWYSLSLRDNTDAELDKIKKKLQTLGVSIDVSSLRSSIQAAIGATPFNASLSFGNTRADLESLLLNNKFGVNTGIISSKLYDSIKAALDGWNGAEVNIIPKKKQLRKAVTDALLSAGFELNVNKVNGLSAIINNALASGHDLQVNVDANKLADAIDKAVKAYKGPGKIPVEVKEKVLLDSIRNALKSEKFPIKVIIKKAEAQEAVRQALQAAGLQGSGYSVSDKRRADAESNRIIAEAKAAAANALAQQRMANAHRVASRASDSHIRSSISLGSAMRSNIRIAGELGPMLASAYSVVALKNFMQKVVEIGGELEKQKLAMNAILGDKGFANTITSKINTLAVKSPFGVMELNQYAKQLTAFQIPYNELYDTMKRMADVSAAVDVDMGRIILAYGQVRAAKFLKGTELRQFTEANIPMIDMLAQRFTKLKGEMVSAGDIMDMISKKQISFEDVKAVLWDLTGEGGKFHNMQEVLSESVQAKWKNLADAIDLMYADIAQSTSGPLKWMAEVLTELTRNWKTVGAAIAAAIVSFGAFRVGMFLANKIIAANNASLFLNTIAVGANINKWQYLRAVALDSLRAIGQKIKSFFLSVRGMMMTATLAAGALVEAIVILWQRQSEEAKKAEQLGDDLYTSATEGAKNLKQLLGSMPKYSGGMGDAELSAGIEKMTEAVKNYSRTADRDLMRSMTNQQGEVATLSERYETLYERLEQVRDAMNEEVKNGLGKLLSNAVQDADSGWFDDNLLTDIEDFTESYETAQKELAKAIKDNLSETADLVKKAKESSPSFAAIAIDYPTDEQAFAELIRNWDRYSKDWQGKIDKSVARVYMHYYSKYGSALIEVQNELRETIQKQMDRLAIEGITPENLTSETKYSLIEWFDKVTDGLPEFGKIRARRIFESMWKVDLDEGKAEMAVVEQYGKMIDETFPELARRMKAGLELKDMELIDYSNAAMLVASAADNVMRHMPRFRDKIQGYLNDNTFIARVVLGWQGTNQDSDLKKMLWSGDKNNLGFHAWDAEKVFDQMENGAKSTMDVRDAYIKEGKAIKEKIEAAKKNTAAGKELAQLQEKWNLTAESFRRAHFGSLEEAIKEKSGSGRTRDTLAEELKAKFKDLKDAWAMYKNWQKSVGDEAAFDTVANSGLFKYIEIDEIPRSVEAYDKAIQKLQKQLEDAGVKGYPARESLLNEIIKTLFDVRKSVVDEQLKLALDKVSKEAERQLENWNLYDKVRKATGNKQLAFNLAFGIEGSGETDYVAMIKKQFGAVAKAADSALTFDTATPEKLANAPEEVRKAWEKANDDIQKYFNKQREEVADILGKYQSLQDKLAKIDYDRGEETRKVSESKELTDSEKAEAIQRINVEADYQKFTQSSEYLQFFAGIYALTEQEATRVGDLIEQNLNKRLQAGTISAEDYYKEIERVKQQLDKIRNVKSDAMTFMTGGVKGLNEKRTEENSAKRLQLTQEIGDIEAKLQEARKNGDKATESLLKIRLKSAKNELSVQERIRDSIIKNQQQWQTVIDFANIASGLAGGLSDAFNSIRDMAEALGADTESGIWADLGAVMDTLTTVTEGISKIVQSVMNGDIGGILSGAVSTLTTPFTIWATLHDKKLQKMIEHSKEYSQQLQYINDAIERRMESFLGNPRNLRVDQAEKDAQTYKALNAEIAAIEARAKASGGMDVLDAMLLDYYRKEADRLGKRAAAYQEGGAYGYQRQLMTEQLEELEKQKAAMEDMKKKDPEAIADITDQIDELTIKIQDFAEETAKNLYGIDIKGWASELGDAIFEAWKKGEDGAEAFRKKAGEIIGDVMNEILKIGILEPMMQNVHDYLFGKDGKSGAFRADLELSPDEVSTLAGKIMAGMEGVDAYTSALDQLEKVLQEKYGLSMKEDEGSKSGLTAGIQALTENTGDLLASYINGMRGDVSVQTHELWPRLLDTALPQISVIAQSQLDAQRQIAEYTRRNAEAAEAIVKSNNDISRLLARVTQGAAKFYVN